MVECPGVGPGGAVAATSALDLEKVGLRLNLAEDGRLGWLACAHRDTCTMGYSLVITFASFSSTVLCSLCIKRAEIIRQFTRYIC
jgi:hypothetical protein